MYTVCCIVYTVHCIALYCICITQLEIEEWEYWLIKPKARGPDAQGLRALSANIPTPLNCQLGNTGSIYHLTSRNNQQLSQENGLGNTKNVLGNTKNCTGKYSLIFHGGVTGFG